MDLGRQPFDGVSARDILTVVFKHKYLILGTFLAIALFAIASALQIRPSYEAKSTLLIKIGREFFQRPEGPGAPSVGAETIMGSEISMLTSQQLMRQVIERIGLDNLYPEIGKTRPEDMTAERAAIKFFETDLKVRTLGGSTLIQISFSHPNPYVAAQVVNTVVDLFRDMHLEVFSEKSSGFLTAQARVFRDRLSISEKNLAAFKDRNHVFSFEEQKSALINQRTTFDSALKTLHSQMDELQQRMAVIRNPKWVSETPERVKTQMGTLEQRERELLQKYNESSEPVQALREQIRRLSDSITKQSQQTRQEELAKAEGELSVLKAKADSLAKQIQRIETAIQSLDSRGRELQALKRGAAEEEQNYQAYARKLEESLIMDDMDRRKMVAIRVVEKSIPSALLPKKQRLGKRKTVAAGMLGGAATGICLAFLLEFMSGGMTTSLSAERRLGLPVMVAIAKK